MGEDEMLLINSVYRMEEDNARFKAALEEIIEAIGAEHEPGEHTQSVLITARIALDAGRDSMQSSATNLAQQGNDTGRDKHE